MGADIKQLRTRIKSVDSTLHLTEAMGLVASSKIRKATDAMLKSREYTDALSQTVARLTASAACRKSPFLAVRDGDEAKTLLVVIAGDRGLAGGYNANIFRLLRAYPEASILPIGKRACDRFGGEVRYAEPFSYAMAKDMAAMLCRAFEDKTYDRVGIVFTQYHSMMSQEASLRWLLPLQREEAVTSGYDAVFEPDELTVLHAALPHYIAGMLLASVRESFACEVAARRVAMDSAGKNAHEMLDRLGLAYNRARQGAITQEITEIVAGSGI